MGRGIEESSCVYLGVYRTDYVVLDICHAQGGEEGIGAENVCEESSGGGRREIQQMM